jgi:hypothetical protein
LAGTASFALTVVTFRADIAPFSQESCILDSLACAQDALARRQYADIEVFAHFHLDPSVYGADVKVLQISSMDEPKTTRSYLQSSTFADQHLDTPMTTQKTLL